MMIMFLSSVFNQVLIIEEVIIMPGFIFPDFFLEINSKSVV